MKSKYILIAALVMAIVTTVLFRQYLTELDKKYKANQNLVEVIVPKTKIIENQKITKDLLEYKSVNADSVISETIRKVSEIEGSYAKSDLSVGQMLTQNEFTNQFKEEKLITRKIREGYRAVSIEVNYVESVSTLVEPEDYVDIAFSEKIKPDGTLNVVATQTILENVRVLAVGDRIAKEDLQISNPKTEEQKANGVKYTSVTVELKPEDVVKLINSDERGNIKLVLRSKVSPE